MYPINPTYSNCIHSETAPFYAYYSSSTTKKILYNKIIPDTCPLKCLLKINKKQKNTVKQCFYTNFSMEIYIRTRMLFFFSPYGQDCRLPFLIDNMVFVSTLYPKWCVRGADEKLISGFLGHVG